MPNDTSNQVPLHAVADRLMVGDLVFIRSRARPFVKLADALLTWTNHVCVVVSTHGPEPMIAESVAPVSRLLPLSRLVGRSHYWRVAVRRLHEPMTALQQVRLQEAACKRLGVFYDMGFNLDSKRQFCAKFVREVMHEATGHHLGEVECLSELLSRNPTAKLLFWKVWFLGRIPWERKTITTASLLQSPLLQSVFDGHVLMPSRAKAAQWPGESELGISSLPAA